MTKDGLQELLLISHSSHMELWLESDTVTVSNVPSGLGSIYYLGHHQGGPAVANNLISQTHVDLDLSHVNLLSWDILS